MLMSPGGLLRCRLPRRSLAPLRISGDPCVLDQHRATPFLTSKPGRPTMLASEAAS
jgi:hypothetical protein